MKTGKIKMVLFITILVLGIFSLFYGATESMLDDIYLKRDFAYTISNNISVTLVSKGGIDTKYTFFLKGKWYAGHTSLSLNTEGKKYFIKFYPPNPNRNEPTEVIADSADIKNLPPGGYKKLPHQ